MKVCCYIKVDLVRCNIYSDEGKMWYNNVHAVRIKDWSCMGQIYLHWQGNTSR